MKSLKCDLLIGEVVNCNRGGRGDWPKMDHYDNTDHPLYLGPW